MALTPLESLLVFSAIILQQDQSVCRAADMLSCGSSTCDVKE